MRLAKILNCHQASLAPCDQCASCRKINSGNHPDVAVLAPAKASIGIEQVLKWQEAVYRKRYEGKYKVFLIEQADRLTLPAANALLKVIEEPPENTLIILSAENAANLLSTIRSRAQSVFFPYLQEEEWLEGVEAEKSPEARQAFALSGGNADLATAILEVGVQTVAEWLDRFWDSVRSGDFSKLFSLFPLEKEDGHLYVQLIALGLEERIVRGEIHPRAAEAARFALKALDRQAAPRLVIECLMLDLAECLVS